MRSSRPLLAERGLAFAHLSLCAGRHCGRLGLVPFAAGGPSLRRFVASTLANACNATLGPISLAACARQDGTLPGKTSAHPARIILEGPRDDQSRGRSVALYECKRGTGLPVPRLHSVPARVSAVAVCSARPSTTARGLAAFSSGDARFLAGELVGRAFLMRGPTSLGCDCSLRLRVHCRETARRFPARISAGRPTLTE